MCGEKGATRLNAARPVGSPPRVRGKARSAARSLISTGITPACAGKRACRCRSRRDTRDHPRVCGEKSRCPAQSPARRGSPPRVRGKVRSSAVYCTPPRITPACAGKRRCASTSLMHRWDHPRVCGEKSTASACLFTITGSPPRVRGKAILFASVYRAIGITPACAGKRNSGNLCLTITGDHPRVCGEKKSVNHAEIVAWGSPPRVRGKDDYMLLLRDAFRITPACAGKRRCTGRCNSRFWDHPRVCGEKVSTWLMVMVISGSPPRVRGKA